MSRAIKRDICPFCLSINGQCLVSSISTTHIGNFSKISYSMSIAYPILQTGINASMDHDALAENCGSFGSNWLLEQVYSGDEIFWKMVSTCYSIHFSNTVKLWCLDEMSETINWIFFQYLLKNEESFTFHRFSFRFLKNEALFTFHLFSFCFHRFYYCFLLCW